MTRAIRQMVPDYLGSRLRHWRKSIGLKGYQLAMKIGISQGSLSDIENNKSLPSAETLAKLHKITGLNIIWLLMGDGPMHRGPDQLTGGESNEEDENLKNLIELITKVYRQGDKEKLAHLEGFLYGADIKKDYY